MNFILVFSHQFEIGIVYYYPLPRAKHFLFVPICVARANDFGTYSYPTISSFPCHNSVITDCSKSMIAEEFVFTAVSLFGLRSH